MKLTTRGRYGLRAMVDLSCNKTKEPVPLKTIAKRQDVSESYLEQLISALRKAKLVVSVRGAQGGYVLAKNPKDITVGDVLRALEGPIALVDCVLEGEREKCSRKDICITKSVWEKINENIIKTVDSITLQDICDDIKNKGIII